MIINSKEMTHVGGGVLANCLALSLSGHEYKHSSFLTHVFTPTQLLTISISLSLCLSICLSIDLSLRGIKFAVFCLYLILHMAEYVVYLSIELPDWVSGN
jgi:hypothetical protein